MIRNLLFDMDGVLIDSEPLHFRIWRDIFRQRGLELAYEDYLLCVGSNMESLFGMAKGASPVTMEERPGLIEIFRKEKDIWLREHGVPTIPGVRETVEELHRRGYHMAVASSSAPRYIELCIGLLGIRSCFEQLCSGYSVAHPKPAPDIFLAAAASLGARPEECLVIEDSRNGCLAAQAAGMECWGFRNLHSGMQDLSTAAWIFEDFTALSDRLPELN